ncbi:MAG: DNA repair protein RecO [Flavobacteriales bacterium]|nr:DNA repair protein RecO [Flavobacteriales bacterium]MBL6872737.1 DNA repair protein RecO [Flavobacteriales bacterium]
MHQQTKGIVLSKVKYAESSIICKIYTSEFGTQSYIVNGVRKKKGNSGYYQVLNQLELNVYNKNGKELHRIKEVKMSAIYSSIPFDVYKSSIALFIAEILSKCLKEEVSNSDLFGFLETALIDLDNKDFDSQFHIKFLVALSQYLGISPNIDNHELAYFDLLNGQFTNDNNQHKHYTENTKDVFLAFKHDKVKNKRETLNILLEYYKLHIEGFNTIKSKDVLEKVLNS